MDKLEFFFIFPLWKAKGCFNSAPIYIFDCFYFALENGDYHMTCPKFLNDNDINLLIKKTHSFISKILANFKGIVKLVGPFPRYIHVCCAIKDPINDLSNFQYILYLSRFLEIHPLLRFPNLEFISFPSLLSKPKLQILYDYKTGNLPKSFDNKWRTIEERLNRAPLRNSNLFDIPYCRIDLVNRLPFSCIPSTWNNFDKIWTKNETSRKAFNCLLKLDLLIELKTNCQRENVHECQNS